MGEIETVEAEKMGWLDLPRGTSYPTFPYTWHQTKKKLFLVPKSHILPQAITFYQILEWC